MTRTLTIPELKKAGLEALRERLGPAGMIRFLQEFSSGSGDYTRDRAAWLDELTLDQLVEKIAQFQKPAAP
ncbi:hypothetical protein RAS2_33180 [Phycisphaerae bacterium RAS2]|nr:hypothetical protein RAS2_33180 [Phycisphaerae bacterium RAS2]